MKIDPLKKNNVKVINDHITDRTLIFAHGFGTDQTSWNEVLQAFRDEYRIVLYDNVGAGGSAPEAFSPNKYDNLGSYANDVIDICHTLHIKDAVIVGHSVSGMISTLAAIKEPELFSRMVLIGASARYLNDEGYNGGFDQPSLDGFYDAMSTNYFAWVSGFSAAAMANADKPELARYFADTLNSIRPDIAQSVARVIFQSDHRKDLPKLEKPVLLLQTKQDIAVPIDAARYLHDHIAGSKLEVIDAEGHFPHISAASEVIREIKNYISV